MKLSSIGLYTPLKTVVVAGALIMGAFASKGDHYVFNNPTYEVSEDPGTSGSDDIFDWGTSLSYSEGDSVSGSGSTLSWGGSLSSQAQVSTETFWGPATLHGGHTMFISGYLYSDVNGSWVSDANGPVAGASLDYTVSVSGRLYGGTSWGGDRYDLVTLVNEGAEASADYNTGPVSGYISLAGGVTNGTPNDAVGGGVTSQSNVDIDSSDIDTSDEQGALWSQEVTFSVTLSDSYPMGPGEDPNASPQIDVASGADLVIWTSDETDWEGVQAGADGESSISLSVSYTVTSQY